MSYTKQNWQTGDIITAEKLNHMEDGIEELSKEYDFILYHNIDSTAVVPISASALGISPDDLFDKIDENGIIKTICIATRNTSEGRIYYLPSNYTTYENIDEMKILVFKYNDLDDGDVFDIQITDSGLVYCTYQTDGISGTYTYSNGEYEFSFGSEPPQ